MAEEKAKDPTLTAVSGWLYAIHGVYMIVAGTCLAFFSWLIPMLVARIVASDVINPDDVPLLAKGVLDHRELMPLTALPVLALGITGLTKAPWRMLWVILGMVALLLPALLLVYTFIVSVGLLYQPNPL